MNDVSYTDLNNRLAQLEAERAEIERQLAAKRKERRKELLQEFRERAESEGFSLEEIIGGSGRSRPPLEQSGSRPIYRLNSDPSKTYKRGRLPDWMRQMMSDLGLNPKSAEDRDKFKAEHMTKS